MMPSLSFKKKGSCWWLTVLAACSLLLISRGVHGFVTPTTTTTTTTTPNSRFTIITTPSSSSSSSCSTTALHGIPKMFRWLTDQYPDIVNRQLEQGLSEELQVENFYLDMVRFTKFTNSSASSHVCVCMHLMHVAHFLKSSSWFVVLSSYIFYSTRMALFIPVRTAMSKANLLSWMKRPCLKKYSCTSIGCTNSYGPPRCCIWPSMASPRAPR